MASSLASLTALVEAQNAEQARLASSLSALVDQTRRKDEAQIKYIQSLEQRLAGFERALGDLSVATDGDAGGGLGGPSCGLARSGSPASTVQAAGRSSPASAYSNRMASSPSRPTSPLSPASMASVASVGSAGGSCSPTNAAESNRRLMTMVRLGDPTQQDKLRAIQASARDVELVAGENAILQSRLVQQARASEKRIGAIQHRLARAQDENLELRGAVSRWSQESRMIKDDFAIHVGNKAVAAAVQDASIGGGRGGMAAGGFSSSSSSSAAAAARESPPSRFDQAARRRKLRFRTTAASGARGSGRKGRSAFSSARGVGRLDVSPDPERDCDEDLSSAMLYSFDGGGGFDDDDDDDGSRSEGASQILGHASEIASVGAEDGSDDYEGLLNPTNGGRGRVFDSADLTRLRQDAKARRSARQELRHFAEIDF
jgi:hypothetical protein